MSASTVEFAHLRIAFDSRILRPRSWTAMQSRWAAELLLDRPAGPILELCSGAGHIGLLAAALADRDLVAVDVDPVACAFTRLNARAAGLDRRVEVRESSLSAAISSGERFALVIADPPWVSSDAVGAFPDDPLLAIDGGPDGMDVARTILGAVAGHLPPGGSLLMQLRDASQAATVGDWGHDLGWEPGELRTGERGVVQQLVWSAPTA